MGQKAQKIKALQRFSPARVRFSHPAPTNQRVTVVSATDLFRNRGATGGTRINPSDKVAANKKYSPRFLLSMTPTVVQQ
jgi:hypothetical protein